MRSWDDEVDFVSDDIVVRLPAAPPGLPREAAGRPAFAEFLAGVGQLWTSWSMPVCAVHGLADDLERAVVEYASDSVNRDGSPYRNTYLSMARVRGGRLVEFTEFFDTGAGRPGGRRAGHVTTPQQRCAGTGRRIRIAYTGNGGRSSVRRASEAHL